MFCETLQIRVTDVSSQKLKKKKISSTRQYMQKIQQHKAVDAKNSVFLICHP